MFLELPPSDIYDNRQELVTAVKAGLEATAMLQQ
jgi:hypothetical protein